ncbi:MAG: hypothetical protein KDB90_09540 [Planctomycetes bacterium]|nr:hypothetical protein [Planctomycetota bacterium]
MMTTQDTRWRGIDCPDRAEEERLALEARFGWVEVLLAIGSLILLLTFCGVLAAQGSPEIELQCPPGTPVASGSTVSNTGPSIVQGKGYYLTVRVVNVGTAPLTMPDHGSIATWSNCVSIWYHLSPPAWTTTLAPGEWQEFSIGWQPNSPGAWDITYELVNNDTTGNESPYVVSFTGNAVDSDVGVAPTLRVLKQPIGGLTSTALYQQPTVEALDASGSRDTSFNGPVTVSMFGGAGATGQLGGTLTVNAVNGLASFTDLVGTQTDSLYAMYNLKFSTSGYSDAHSQAFMLWNFTTVPGGPIGGGGGSGSGSGGGGGGGGGCVAAQSSLSIAMLAGLTAILIFTRRRRLARR